MADIKAIKGLDNVTYNLRDDYSKWGGENLLLNIPKRYVANDYLAYQLNLTENLIVGERYTLQLWGVTIAHSGKTAAQLNPAVYWGGGYISLCGWAGQCSNGGATYLKATFTPTYSTSNTNQVNTANNAWIEIYNTPSHADGTKNMIITKWKLEFGDKATDWSPCYKDIFTVSGTELQVNL